MTDFNYRATLDNILKNVSLGIRPSTLQKSYTPCSHLTLPLPADISEESQGDHPQVKFWHKADWSKYQEVEKSKPTDPLWRMGMMILWPCASRMDVEFP